MSEQRKIIHDDNNGLDYVLVGDYYIPILALPEDDFFRNMFGGVGCDMIGNLFGNIGKGNVSGMSIVGLVAAAFMVFGRFGWMSKIAGALLGAMIIGNNSKVAQTLPNRGGTSSHGQNMKEAETQSRGMKR